MAVDVGSAVGYLDIDIRGFLDGLKTANTEALNQSNKIKSNLDKIGDFGTGAMKAGKNITKFVTLPVIAAGGTIVKLFGDLQQSLGGTEVVFGKYANIIQTKADEAYKNMGASANQYMQTANVMASLFQGSGITQQKSLDMTTMAMQRAADVASVMGISTQMALDSITGAAKGNFTMMDNLGVAMNATTLKAYALEKGINFEWETATNAQKSELAMQMFFEKTQKYAGNFARESEETITGSFGQMKAAWTNFMAGIGNPKADMKKLQTNMVNAFKTVVSNVKVVLSTIWDNIPLPDWAKWAITTVAALGPVITVVGGIAKSVVAVSTAFKAVDTAMKLVAANPMSLTFMAIAAGVGLLTVALVSAREAHNKFYEDAIAADKARAGLNKAMADASAGYEETVSDVMAADQAARSYIDRLGELQEKTNLTTEEQAEQVRLIELLKATMPGLNIEIDTQTGKIAGTTKALQDQRKEWLDLELSKAVLAKQTQEVEALAEAKIKLAKAEQQWAKKTDEMLKKGGEQANMWFRIRDAVSKAGYDLSEFTDEQILGIASHTASMQSLADEYRGLGYDYDRLVEQQAVLAASVDSLTVTYDEANQQIILTGEAVASFGKSMEDAGVSVDNLTGKTEEVPVAVDNINKSLKETADNVINNFEKIKFSSDVTIDGLIKNLQKNEAVFSATMGSMEQLADKGINKGVLAYLYNLGPQGWEYINKLALATDEQMKEFERLMLSAGQGGSDGFVDELEGLPPDVKAILGILETDAEEAGGQIPKGAAAGVDNNTSSLTGAVRRMAAAAVKAARNSLVINSPSKVFEDDIGFWIPEGVAVGVEKNMPAASKKMQESIDKGISGIDVSIPTTTVESNVSDFAKNAKSIYNDVADWFSSVEERMSSSVKKMTNMLKAVSLIGSQLSPAFAMAGYSIAPQIQQAQQAQQQINKVDIAISFNNYAEGITANDARRIGREMGIEVEREMRSKGVSV